MKNVEYGMSIILFELYTNKRAAACLTSIQSTHCAIMLTDLHREHYACHSMVTYHGYTERTRETASCLQSCLTHSLPHKHTHNFEAAGRLHLNRLKLINFTSVLLFHVPETMSMTKGFQRSNVHCVQYISKPSPAIM